MTIKTDPNRPDVLAALAARRPIEATIADAWSQSRADAALAVTLGRVEGPPSLHVRNTRIRSTRRWAVLVAAGAAVAAAALTATTLFGSPSQLPAAAALDTLARTASEQPPIVMLENGFAHMVASEVQDGRVPELPDSDRTLEAWINNAGTMWRKDSDSTGAVQYFVFRRTTGQSLNQPTAAFLASLPADPAKLAAYLRANVTGSSSPDEAVFVGVGDMLRWGLATPTLTKAAIEVLSDLPGVTTTEVTFAGHEALRVDFVDEPTRPGWVQSLYFDRATAEVLGDGMHNDDVDFTRTVLVQGIVSDLPIEVGRKAVDEESKVKPKSDTGASQTS